MHYLKTLVLCVAACYTTGAAASDVPAPETLETPETSDGQEAPDVQELPERPYPAEWYGGTPQQQAFHAELEGQSMPPLVLEGWINGAPTAEELAGEIVVVDFWALWCAPCMAAIPKKNEFAQRHAADGVLILGPYGSRIDDAKLQKAVEDHAIAYPVGQDPEGVNVKAWRAIWMPTYAVVDRHGVVRALGLESFERVEQVVLDILEEQPAPAQTP